MADIARLALQIDVNGAQRAKQALDGLRTGSVRATKVTTQLAAASQKTGRSLKLNNQLYQQAGFQVGDFATQVASGQNALVAFTQQFSQLAQFIGPAGPILGAVAAIGGGIAIGLVNAFGEGEDATEKLVDKTKELVEQLGEATRRQREFINASFQQEISAQEQAIRDANEAIFDANTRLERFRKLNEDVPAEVFNSNEAVKGLRQELDDARLSLDNANSGVEAARQAQEEFWKEVEKASEVEQKQVDELEKLVEGYQAQADAIGKSARELAIYEARRLGATEADLASINAAFQQIEAEEARQKAIKESNRLQQEQQQLIDRLDPAGAAQRQYFEQIEAIEQFNISAQEKEFLREQAFEQHQEKMAQIARKGGENIALGNEQGLNLLTEAQSSAIGAIGNIFGNLASITEKGGKDSFNAYKRFAQAQALVSTSLAVANALATPPAPLGIALAGTIAGLGAVQVAAIEQQEYQGSFEGGGFTGSGARAGGIDGRGGFPAILHPNETIVDHTRGQSTGGVTVNVMNAPPGTRTEERTDANGNRFVDVFISDMANGGPMSRSIQQTYGVRRQGR